MKREALRHPKTYDLAARLGVTPPMAVGLIEYLLDYCADVSPQGNIGKWSNAAIARGCMWEGDPDDFICAFVESGWIDEDDEHRLIIHDLADHAPNWWHAKLKKLNLSFLAASKNALRSGQDEDKSELREGQEAAILLTSSHLTSPHPNTASAVCSESASLDPEPPAPPVERSEFVFPVQGKGAPPSKAWALPMDKLQEYRESYPGLDVDAEIRKARQWCRDKANRRKTPGGMLAFLTGWLNRANDNPRAGPQQGPRSKVTSGRFEGNADSEF